MSHYGFAVKNNHNMKKFLFVILGAILFALSANADLRYVENSFKNRNDADIQQSGTDLGKQNMTAALTDFEYNHNGTVKRGLLRISFKNLSNEDIRDKVTISVYPFHHGPVKYIINPTDGHLECWVQVDPDTNHTLDVTVEDVGSVRIPNLKVESEHMYTLEVESDETVAVTFNSTVEGTKIWFDGTILGGTAGKTSTVRKDNATLGRHIIKAESPSGNVITKEIEVSKANTSFPLDLRRYYKVNFSSNEKGVSLYENGKQLASLPATLEVAEGPHAYTLRKLGYPDQSHNVNVSADGGMQLDIVKRMTIEFRARQNNRDISGAQVHLSGLGRRASEFKNEYIGNTPMSYELPYGEYDVWMMYGGRQKSGTLKVNDNKKDPIYRLDIPAKVHSRFNPFGIDYHKRTGGFTMAWVQKWYSWSLDGSSESGNYFGADSHMQGFQIGIPVQPYFGYGLGLNTGLYFEGYFCSEDGMDLTELCLYMPVDLMIRIPLGEEFSVFLNGGIGIDWSMGMTLKEDGYEDYDIDYGEAGAPRHFNFSAEVGGGLQYKALQVSAQYQMGLTDNPLMTTMDEVSVKMRKLAIQLSFMF